MIIQKLVVGSIEANCYILGCEMTYAAIVIDPGSDADDIFDAVNKQNLQTSFIINTHAHIDHIGANPELKEKTSAPLCIHSSGAEILVNPQRNLSFFMGTSFSSPAPDRLLEDGDILEAGTLRLKVVHTPGHSPDSICLMADDCIFAGDLLFAGGIGRYDFPGSSYTTLMNSLQKIMALNDDIIVYPGHGPETTIGIERRMNPFLNF